MINHCEEGDCWEALYRVLCREDESNEFTIDSVEKVAAHDTKHFQCPQPYCSDLFTKFSGLIDHLEVMECGIWLEERGGDELNYLKSYLS